MMLFQVSKMEAKNNHLDKQYLVVDVTDRKNWIAQPITQLTGEEFIKALDNPRLIFFRKEDLDYEEIINNSNNSSDPTAFDSNNSQS